MMEAATLNKQIVPTNPMIPDVFTVTHIRKETHDTFTFELVAKDGNKKFSFLPGQFNMLYVFGVGEVPVSICGNPDEKEKLVHTVRAVGPVTKAMSQLKTGQQLGVRGPYGSFWPVKLAAGKDVIIIGGGIGLAPLKPILYSLMAQRENYGRIALLYGTRSPDEILYKKELERWRSRLDLQIYVTVDRAANTWKGNVGVVTKLFKKLTFDPGNAFAFTCGPEIMMRFTGQELEKQGVLTERIFLSMERNMKCAIGLCGHCQLRHLFICKDGPVFRYNQMLPFLTKREI